MSSLSSAFSAGWHHYLWLALLIAASLSLTLGFACAVPFAAFGAVAAMTLSRRDALLLTVALWLVNQIIGFTVLHYPWDATTLAWGAILGVVALFSTGAALMVTSRFAVVASAIAGFAAAFLAYEGSLYLASLVLGATEDFAAAIVVRILEINAASYAALLAAALLAAGASSRVGSPAKAATPILSR